MYVYRTPQITLHRFPASCLNVSLFAHVHYLSHLHSCGVCIFSLFIGNHLYIYSICIVKATSRLVVYRFILFYFVLYICIHVAPWSSVARYFVPLYVHRCSGMTIKIGLMSAYFIHLTWRHIYVIFRGRVLHNCVLLNVFMPFSYKI